jgi:hypothetical protein
MRPNPLLEATQALMLERLLADGHNRGTDAVWVVRLLVARATLGALLARLGVG